MLGRSIKGIADDLQNRITTMSRASAIRTARTAITGAQNAGRMDCYAEAKKIGIQLKKQWQATLDNRTRHSHAMLDGVQVENEEKFPNGCRFPGDQQGAPAEIYNCRCTLISKLDGVNTSNAQRRAQNPVTGEWELIPDMTYKEWAAWKESENKTAWDLYMKKGRNLSADDKQWQEYRKVLGKKVPNTLDSFQNLKYTDPETWKQLQKTKRQTVFITNAPCVTTKKKYSGHFLKEGAKHADQFFGVGYTANDVLQLRYDMAKQFDMSKAVNRAVDKNGIKTFNIYMMLGVTKQKSFLTGWQIDKPGDKPRIITAFRREQP